MKISEIFKLNKTQFELDFIDIDIDDEVPLFLDGHIFATRNDSWSQRCNEIIEDFFRHINELIRLDRVEQLIEVCQHLNEPNETCLGFSKGKPRGSFQNAENMAKIFMNLYDLNKDNSGLFDVVKSISDLKFFISKVGSDTISDIITNLIRLQLMIYTKEQCELHNIPTTALPSNPYWDEVSSSWFRESSFEQLIIDKRKILLVPKGVVFFESLYSFNAKRFSQHDVLNFLQQEELKVPDSPLVKYRVPKKNEIVGRRYVTKKDLREVNRVDNKQFLLEFCRKYPEIMERFKKNESFRSLTIPQLYGVNKSPINTADYNLVIDAFIDTLKRIPTGKTNASKYHDSIVGILTFIFYPSLSNPKKETPIDENSRRIDITYTNTASDGFFHNLKSEIVSNYIYVECKNYSVDVSNPEVDQLNGRFNKSSSKVGLLVCRSIENKVRALRKVSGIYRRTESLIMPITDKDIISMLGLMKVDNQTEVSLMRHEDILYEIKRSIEVENF